MHLLSDSSKIINYGYLLFIYIIFMVFSILIHYYFHPFLTPKSHSPPYNIHLAQLCFFNI